jgi:hypothetical protein
MARRNGSHEQRGERWVSVSSSWTAQPPPSWIPRGNPKARRNPSPSAPVLYLEWLAAYNNLPKNAFLPGGSQHRSFVSEGMESPSIQAVIEPPPTPVVPMTEAEGQKAATEITKKAQVVIETQQQNTADSVEAIERNIAELKNKVFRTGSGKDWSRVTAGRGAPPKEYTAALKDLELQLEAARRLQGTVQTAAAVVQGAKTVTRTRKQKPADAVPVVVAAAQDATAAAEQAQALSENVAETVAEIAADAGVPVTVVESVPAPIPAEAEVEVAEAQEDPKAALMAALMDATAVQPVVEAPAMTEEERKRAERKARFAKTLGNPRARSMRANGVRRNGIPVTPAVEKALKAMIKQAGANKVETEEVFEGLRDLLDDAAPKAGQTQQQFLGEFIDKVQASIQTLIAIVREEAGTPAVAAEIVATTPPAPVIVEAPVPEPSPVVAPSVVAAAVSGEGMTDAQMEAEIKRLISEVIDEMLGESVKSNPLRRRR